MVFCAAKSADSSWRSILGVRASCRAGRPMSMWSVLMSWCRGRLMVVLAVREERPNCAQPRRGRRTVGRSFW